LSECRQTKQAQNCQQQGYFDLHEFPPNTLEALRQDYETGRGADDITVAEKIGNFLYPLTSRGYR
jgi:hypothetical protein